MATVCRQFQHVKEGDSAETIKEKRFLNSILADRKPYFFRYKYRQTDKEYRDYITQKDEDCHQHFRISLEELLAMSESEMTQEQKEFKDYYNRFLPVITSKCVMNKICWYIESIDFNIKKKIRSFEKFDPRTLQSGNFVPNDKKLYEQVYELVTNTIKKWNSMKGTLAKDSNIKNPTKSSGSVFNRENEYLALKMALEELCPNDETMSNYLIQLFYVDKPSLNKNILWELYGKQIYENIRSKVNVCYFPKKNSLGSMEFLYENYSIEKVDLCLVRDSEELQAKELIGEII